MSWWKRDPKVTEIEVRGVVFHERGNGLRLAEHGGVDYWIGEMIDESVEVTLTADAGHQRRRLGRWIQEGRGEDLVKARALISEHHDTMLALASGRSAA